MAFVQSKDLIFADGNPFNRKFCGFISLRGGCGIACAIWLGVNTYIATISFQGQNPIFSFLNKPALLVLGSLSIVFSLVSIFILLGLFIDSASILLIGVSLLIIVIPVYLLDILANIFIFGIQKSLYMNWCIESSRNNSSEKLMIILDSSLGSIEFDPTNTTTLNTFNCQKLWEDEIKFSIAIFITMSICYIYWSICVYHYYQKLDRLFPQVRDNRFMSYVPHYLYNNYPPSKI